DRRVEAPKRAHQRHVELHQHEQGRGEAAPGLQATDRSLADTGKARELLLRQTDELANVADAAAELAHPLRPVDGGRSQLPDPRSRIRRRGVRRLPAGSTEAQRANRGRIVSAHADWPSEERNI